MREFSMKTEIQVNDLDVWTLRSPKESWYLITHSVCQHYFIATFPIMEISHDKNSISDTYFSILANSCERVMRHGLHHISSISDERQNISKILTC